MKDLLLKIAPLAILLLSLIGLTDTVYLTRAHYTGLALGCVTIGGCEKVTESQYATIGNVPLALLGALYYFALFALIVAYFIFDRSGRDRLKKTVVNLAGHVTIIGFAVSLLLVYLQLFVIHSICLYCMVSAATSTLLFLFGMALIRISRSLAEERSNAVV